MSLGPSSRPTLALSLLMFAAAAAAQTPAASETAPKLGTSLQVGLVAASSAEYTGANKRLSGVLPSLELSYATRDWGKFSLGTKAKGLNWSFINSDDYSLGIGLGGSDGRSTKKATLLRPGSVDFVGLGEIKPALEFKAFGHYTLGAPLYLQVRRGLGDEKANTTSLARQGHRGTLVDISTELGGPIAKDLSAWVAPSLTWADKNYTNAFFGVSAAQAARSNFKAFDAKGGIRSVGLELGLSYQLSKELSLVGGVNLESLQGDAGKSPLVKKKNQTGAFVGLSYQVW